MSRDRVLLLLVVLPVAAVAGYLNLRTSAAQSGQTVRVGADSKNLAAARQLKVRGPRCVFDHKSFDFGTMEVDQSGQHSFEVRNEGTEPLKITLGSTTCKCTRAIVPGDEIPPGESRSITLEWKTIEPIDGFRHGATLCTNDPRLPTVHVFVEGRVRARLLSVPRSIVLNGVLHGETREAQAMIISQIWDRFELELLDCTLAQARVEPWQYDPELLKANEWHRSAQGMLVKLEAGLPVGTHRGQIRYRVHVADEPEEAKTIRELPITVDVSTPFTIHGRHFDGNTLQIGPIQRGQSRRESALVLARHAPADLEITGVKVSPACLKAAVERADAKTTGTARFNCTIEIPADAPLVNAMAPNPGVVTLETNHPEFPTVKFYVEFAVLAE